MLDLKITILDAKTLGDTKLDKFLEFGSVEIFDTTKSDEVERRIESSDIVVTNKVVLDEEIIKKSKNLKLICVAATGMNNIDLATAKECGVCVKNVAGYSTNSVVQHTFALLFYLANHIKYYDDYVKSNKWERSEIFTNLDKNIYELNGKKWGVIGLGTIGKEVAKIASTFGAIVSYYSTSDIEREEPYPRVELEWILRNCDIISIHAPLNEKTKNLINKENLVHLKERAVLLNLGRGGIVNEADLADEIDKKEIYIGLDVLEKEPMEIKNPLKFVKNRDRVVITPHIAWGGVESRERLVDAIFENIKSFINSINID